MRRAAFLAGAMLLLAASSCASQSATSTMEPPEAIYVDPALAGWNVEALKELETWAEANAATVLVIDDQRIVFEHVVGDATAAHEDARLGQKVIEGDREARAQFQPSIYGAPEEYQARTNEDGVIAVRPNRNLIVVYRGKADGDAAMWPIISKAVPPSKR